MSSNAAKVLADRSARDAAKARFDNRYAVIKADIADRGVAGRLTDEAIEQAKLMFDEAVVLVEEHPAVVAGTLSTLVLWFLRNPIMGLIQKLRDQAAY